MSSLPSSPTLIENTTFDETHFDYEGFLRRMKHPSCKQLILMAKQFIDRFKMLAAQQSTLAAQLVHFFRNFIDSFEQAVRENPVWRLKGEMNPEEYLLAREGIEYLLMNQLHKFAFNLPEDRQKNNLIERKILMHGGWIDRIHLDISGNILLDDQSISESVAEFHRVNEYITPRDKLVCLLNGCQIIQKMVESVKQDASADDILPVIILIILRCKESNFYSNLQYISRFRDPKALASERAYHFTTLLAAATFIERLDKDSLLIDEGEYQNRIKESFQETVEEEINEENPSLPGTMESPTRSPDLNFGEEAAKIFSSVREKVRLGASKSIDFFGKFMDEAEATIRAVVKSNSESENENEEENRRNAQVSEDEFQLQLAMAMSLSEHEYRESQQLKKEGTPDDKLVDISEAENQPDQKPISPELS